MSDLARRNPYAEDGELADLGRLLVSSQAFKDTHSAAQAVVKVLAGRDLGLGPIEAMRSLHFIDGKIELSADLLAQRVKAHPDYDYQVRQLDETGCTIEFFGRGLDGTVRSLGVSTFTEDDRKRAGIPTHSGQSNRPTPWVTYPRNMMFARALSNGVAWYCPDVGGGGRLYVEGEISAFDGDGEGPIEQERPALAVVNSSDHPEPLTVDTSTGEVVAEGDEPTRADEHDPQAASVSHAEPEAAPSPTLHAHDEATADEYQHDHEDGDQEHTHDAALAAPADDEPRATKAQLTKLAIISKEQGWDDDERHRRAGVESFTHLSRSDASALIEAWGDLPPASSDDDPPTAQQWENVKLALTPSQLALRARRRFDKTPTQLSRGELAALIEDPGL